jgi:hypothetical protein
MEIRGWWERPPWGLRTQTLRSLTQSADAVREPYLNEFPQVNAL